MEMLLVLEKLINFEMNFQGMKRMPPEKIARIDELIEPWFIFALIWSVGATGDAYSRVVFSIWLKAAMSAKEVS